MVSFGQSRCTTITEIELSQTQIMRALPLALSGSAVEAKPLITALWDSIDFYHGVSERAESTRKRERRFNFKSKRTVDGEKGPGLTCFS